MSGAPSRPQGRPCRLQPLSLALTQGHPLPPGEGSLPKLHGLKLRLGPRKRPDPWTDVPTGELALTLRHPWRKSHTPAETRPVASVRGLDSRDGPEGQEVGESRTATRESPT